ncbi:MAG: hypothetical protein QM779_17520 [Propionicimonas sp.]|uniref:hypothetical protein n=1 Tax=Propionicimonas sp. TaxID=1955623 RepID=UPI003D144E91
MRATEPARALGLGDLPGGAGAAASLITTPPAEGTPGGRMVGGTVETNSDLIFRLLDPEGTGSLGDARAAVLRGAVPVAPLPELGSPRLAAALAADDLPSVLEALAHDVVVVPALLSGGGLEACAFADEADAAPDLHVFSSAEAFARFPTGMNERLFVVRPGAALVEFASAHASDLARVVFDAAGPRPLELPADLFRAILDVPADDPGSGPAAEPGGEVVGFALPLDGHWATIDLTADEASRRGRIKELVKDQTRVLSDRGAALRHDMREWLGRSTAQAASAGGRQYAFLVARTSEAAAAVSVVTYWHDLGPGVGGVDPLDGVAGSLLAHAGEADELVRLRVDGDQVLRHSRVRAGEPDLGGSDVPVLLVDYWIGVPGPRPSAVAHVAFSTPHLDAGDAITALADTLVLQGRWIAAAKDDRQWSEQGSL